MPSRASSSTEGDGLTDVEGHTSPAGPGRLSACVHAHRCGWDVKALLEQAQQPEVQAAAVAAVNQLPRKVVEGARQELLGLPPSAITLCLALCMHRRGCGGRQSGSDPRHDPHIAPEKAQRILANRRSAAVSKVYKKVCKLVEAAREAGVLPLVPDDGAASSPAAAAAVERAGPAGAAQTSITSNLADDSSHGSADAAAISTDAKRPIAMVSKAQSAAVTSKVYCSITARRARSASGAVVAGSTAAAVDECAYGSLAPSAAVEVCLVRGLGSSNLQVQANPGPACTSADATRQQQLHAGAADTTCSPGQEHKVASMPGSVQFQDEGETALQRFGDREARPLAGTLWEGGIIVPVLAGQPQQQQQPPPLARASSPSAVSGRSEAQQQRQLGLVTGRVSKPQQTPRRTKSTMQLLQVQQLLPSTGQDEEQHPAVSMATLMDTAVSAGSGGGSAMSGVVGPSGVGVQMLLPPASCTPAPSAVEAAAAADPQSLLLASPAAAPASEDGRLLAGQRDARGSWQPGLMCGGQQSGAVQGHGLPGSTLLPGRGSLAGVVSGAVAAALLPAADTAVAAGFACHSRARMAPGSGRRLEFGASSMPMLGGFAPSTGVSFVGYSSDNAQARLFKRKQQYLDTLSQLQRQEQLLLAELAQVAQEGLGQAGAALAAAPMDVCADSIARPASCSAAAPATELLQQARSPLAAAPGFALPVGASQLIEGAQGSGLAFQGVPWSSSCNQTSRSDPEFQAPAGAHGSDSLLVFCGLGPQRIQEGRSVTDGTAVTAQPQQPPAGDVAAGPQLQQAASAVEVRDKDVDIDWLDDAVLQALLPFPGL